ncbi:nucleoside recognition domain-containing protein [Proteinivorax hydrogeniformans]|uniref:Nucleoside recognition domain-containing protein n=1 Tax=Proteinivorax hydrogeniformans TaxID=1826727 RepID=A0AAU8HPN4_9FIRM
MIIFLLESLKMATLDIINLAVIIVPLLIVIEFLKEFKVLDKIGNLFAPLTRGLGLPKETAVPLSVGLFVGLTYGAGVIMSLAKEQNFTKKELTGLLIFVGICHAILEETIVFARIGAAWHWVLIFRILSAVLATLLYKRWAKEDSYEVPNSRGVPQ